MASLNQATQWLSGRHFSAIELPRQFESAALSIAMQPSRVLYEMWFMRLRAAATAMHTFLFNIVAISSVLCY